VHRETLLNTTTKDALENKKPAVTAQTKTPKIQSPEVLPAVDTVDISAGAKKKTDDFQEMFDEMRSKMHELREGLKQAREAGEGAASAWREKIKCLQIAMRIMSGDIVPEEDHRYLREKDVELYSKAIQLRIEKEDPKEYDRLSEDEEKDGIKVSESSANDAPVPAQVQSAEEIAPPPEV